MESHRQSIDEINIIKREAGRLDTTRHRLLTSGRITSREPCAQVEENRGYDTVHILEGDTL